MLRKRMAHAKEQATKLPGPNLTPEQVISETLKMLQQTENDDTPYCDAGVNVVLRLASNRFKLQLRWLVCCFFLSSMYAHACGCQVGVWVWVWLWV